jgi:tetratricopeptide (TPR) repeat protein
VLFRSPLPGGVLRDIRRTARQQDVEPVATAVAVAGEAVEEGDLDRAIELLTWARSRATRSVPIREGLGVTLYLAGRFEDAQRELQAYRRLSGKPDQNHLLADAARALGRTEKVVELIDEMVAAHQAGDLPVERLAEGLIVQAGIRADAGDLALALAALQRVPLPEQMGEVHARVWYASGDVAERMGDPDAARDYFEAVLTVDDDTLDAAERLEALGARS